MTGRTVSAVFGIDPGGKTTALVSLVSGDLHDVCTWTRRKNEPLNDYLRDVCAKAIKVVEQRCSIDAQPLIAIEDINKPSPHLGMTNPQGHLDTSRVIGGLVCSLWPYAAGDIRMIAPAKHGQKRPLAAAYPEQLIGAREGEAGTGRLRHARSAYDIAITARTQHTRRVA